MSAFRKAVYAPSAAPDSKVSRGTHTVILVLSVLQATYPPGAPFSVLQGLRVPLSVDPSSPRRSYQLPWVCVNTLSMASSMNLSAFKRMTTETDGLPLALFAVQSGTLMPRTTASAA